MRTAQFPSNCSTVIFHNFWEVPTQKSLKAAITHARWSNRSLILAVTSDQDDRQEEAAELLKKAGFKKSPLLSLVNLRTGRHLTGWYLRLKPGEENAPETPRRQGRHL